MFLWGVWVDMIELSVLSTNGKKGTYCLLLYLPVQLER